ncbi:hypothetical protein WJ0W_007097 [Paenibacillus melissococcoides]|uniref:Uncharacterized protein n=1 Tax=Paenibacillus melissococcoides TaxID=2912268 RepID=A0ABM9G3N0_9BACL|nr:MULTISPECIES: hypothetical protein [Paenibacillus]MEB9895214.1 hypothetical protein [Bacillus cereus]CAH8246340.1 hypothetical protein WJ0W_003575 [Paenibacillus melissococcoides]CAH8248062.1 hypothetical protein WJ0W_005317 [Paenibacillus melissococcoides]CAH8249603.1 hypothetical protein WJ0W_006788 [Paenibacillus melissococcoides]CAH8249700.1 hypothetical protein WJ0W_006884 [Paenibacillus melissococcoides]
MTEYDYKKITTYTLTPQQLEAERKRLDALKPRARDYKGKTAILAPQLGHNGKYLRKGGEWYC